MMVADACCAVVGCADPDIMPEQTWFERSADGLTATIGCVNADVKWSVRCVDGVWLGYHANCTLGLTSIPLVLLSDCDNNCDVLHGRSQKFTIGGTNTGSGGLSPAGSGGETNVHVHI